VDLQGGHFVTFVGSGVRSLLVEHANTARAMSVSQIFLLLLVEVGWMCSTVSVHQMRAITKCAETRYALLFLSIIPQQP
jgi:hypothetical protein